MHRASGRSTGSGRHGSGHHPALAVRPGVPPGSPRTTAGSPSEQMPTWCRAIFGLCSDYAATLTMMTFRTSKRRPSGWILQGRSTASVSYVRESASQQTGASLGTPQLPHLTFRPPGLQIISSAQADANVQRLLAGVSTTFVPVSEGTVKYAHTRCPCVSCHPYRRR
jgi:hypothetical protein